MLTVKEAAKAIGVTKQTIFTYIRDGNIKAFQVYRGLILEYRILREDVERFKTEQMKLPERIKIVFPTDIKVGYIFENKEKEKLKVVKIYKKEQRNKMYLCDINVIKIKSHDKRTNTSKGNN